MTSCVTAPTNDHTITNAQLIQLAKQADRTLVNGQNSQVIGSHNGIKVIEEFQCSDLCPQNTHRIIHYDVPAGPSCEQVGGVTKSILVPVAIAIMAKEYCFPRVIADEW